MVASYPFVFPIAAALGLVVPLLVAADLPPGAERAPPESTAKVEVAGLPAALERICAEEKGSYHRLLWRAYHVTHNSTVGRDWPDVGPVLQRQRLKRLPSVVLQRGERHRFRLRADGYTTPGGLAHSLIMEFNVSVEPVEGQRSVPRVRWVTVTLAANIHRPFADFARGRPYPAGTVLASALELPDVQKAAREYPVLETVEVSYRNFGSHRVKFNPYVFDVGMDLADGKKDVSTCQLSAFANSGLDPPQRHDGKKRLAGFRSQDVLGPLFAHVGSTSGPSPKGYHRLERIGPPPRQAEVRWAEVYTGADVKALPADTRRVRVMESAFSAGAVKALHRLTRLEELDFEDAETTDDDLAVLGGLSRLKRLHLRGEKLSDAGIVHLVRLTALESFVIWNGPRLTDESCRSLGRIPSLKRVDFGHTKSITDVGVGHLRGLAGLEELSLAGAISDRGLERISRFPKLQKLHLGGTEKLTPDGVAKLTELPALRALSIGYASVNDACLRHLGTIATLEELSFYGLPITDAGLLHLAGLRGLRYLCVWDCRKVTDAGVAALQAKLPGRFDRN